MGPKRYRARWLTVAALALAVWGGPAIAQLHGDWVADNLRTGCRPMGLAATIQGGPHERVRRALGLTEDVVLNAAESRLRSAGLLGDSPAGQSLSIDVVLVGGWEPAYITQTAL